MEKFVEIQVNVPICPECGAMLKFNPRFRHYQCMHCGKRYEIINQGNNDRIMICKEIKTNVQML